MNDMELQHLVDGILQRKVHLRAIEVSLNEFQRLHSMLLKRNPLASTLSVVNLGKEIFIQFSRLSPQHFLIRRKKPFAKSEFGFIQNLIWHGPQQIEAGLVRFLINEFRSSGTLILVTFVTSLFLLCANSDKQLFTTISELVLQSATVFLSIFVIFSVTQNSVLAADKRLFDSGTQAQYYDDDKNLSLLMLISIGLSFLLPLMSNVEQIFPPIRIHMYILDWNLVRGIVGALSLSSLIYSFKVVISYYLNRSRDISERDLVSEFLEQDFDVNKETDTSAGC